VVLPSQLIKDGLVANHHWYLYIPVLLLAFILMVPIMIIAIKKEKEKQAFIGSVALLSISMFAMSIWVNSVVGIAICMLLYFVAFNFLEATMPALVSRIAPASQKGSAMGGYSSSQFLGAFFRWYFRGLCCPNYKYASCVCGRGTCWVNMAYYCVENASPTEK
jgi:MFS family permease